MPQRVVGHCFNSSGNACGLKHFAAIDRRYRAAMRSVWRQPFRQILTDLHKPAPGTFRFDCLDCDQTALEIDFGPIQPLQLGRPSPANAPIAIKGTSSRRPLPIVAPFLRLSEFRPCLNLFCFGSFRARVVDAIVARQRKTECCTNSAPGIITPHRRAFSPRNQSSISPICNFSSIQACHRNSFRIVRAGTSNP